MMESEQEPNPDPHERRTSRRSPARVDVIDAERRLEPAAARWLSANADAALREAGAPAGAHARLLIVGDRRMSELHRRHMGVDGPTDVLTFDLREAPDAPLDADIAVCIDEAARQAALRAVRTERELLLYFVHGVLHCLGHDDHDEADAARMHEREDEILSAIGVGPTFARRAAEAATEPAR